MNTRFYTPVQRIALAIAGYFLIALAPFLLKGGALAALAAAFAYFAFALLLLKAALPMASRTPKPEGHPVQDGKAPLLRRRYRLAYHQA